MTVCPRTGEVCTDIGCTGHCAATGERPLAPCERCGELHGPVSEPPLCPVCEDGDKAVR